MSFFWRAMRYGSSLISVLSDLFTFGQSTAHTVAYAFALLALYQDEQDKLYEHLKSVVPEGRMPVSLFFLPISPL